MTKPRTGLSVFLRKSGDKWLLEMVGDNPESYKLLSEFLQETEKHRDNPHILILTKISGAKGATRIVAEFKITEGPDIIGSNYELEKLRKWKSSD